MGRLKRRINDTGVIGLKVPIYQKLGDIMLHQSANGEYCYEGLQIRPNTWIQDNGIVYRIQGDNTIHVSRPYYDRLLSDFQAAIKEKIRVHILPPMTTGLYIATMPEIHVASWSDAPPKESRITETFYKFNN